MVHILLARSPYTGDFDILFYPRNSGNFGGAGWSSFLWFRHTISSSEDIQ